MATNYVEQATLRLRDESTRQINRINRELLRLLASCLLPFFDKKAPA